MKGFLCISYEAAFKLMPTHFTDDKSTLVQVVAWCRRQQTTACANGEINPTQSGAQTSDTRTNPMDVFMPYMYV